MLRWTDKTCNTEHFVPLFNCSFCAVLLANCIIDKRNRASERSSEGGRENQRAHTSSINVSLASDSFRLLNDLRWMIHGCIQCSVYTQAFQVLFHVPSCKNKNGTQIAAFLPFECVTRSFLDVKACCISGVMCYNASHGVVCASRCSRSNETKKISSALLMITT